MKKLFLKKPHPAEIGAGIGLMLVCTTTMLMDKSMIPFGLFFNLIGFLMAAGIFSQSKKNNKCETKSCGK